MLHKTIALFALFLTFQRLAAQEKLSIDKVYSVTLRNSGTIIENEQIKGYYFFYQSDKIDKKTNEYTLQLADANLNKIKDIKFSDSKDIALLESSYNGSSIMFMFYDDKENMLDYRLYNMDGTKSFTYSKSLDKRSEQYFKQARTNMNNGEESENSNAFDISGKGFLSILPLRENKNYTYEVNFYASDKRKTWTYNPIEDGKYAMAQYLGANDSIAIIEVLSREKMMSKEMESTLVGINLQTGRKAFETRTQDKQYQLYPMNISVVKEGNLLIGPYFEGDDRVMQDNSQGIGIWLMNNQGKIIKSKYSSWSKDLSKFVKVDSKGRVENLGYLFIHNMMQTEDGKFFAIAEGYKKTANAGGIAMSILTQSYSSNVTKLVVTDMLMLEMNDKFEITNAKVYEKNNNSFSLPGADFA
ncbi:MAG: hypothetical protein JWP88_1817, partial [Flaviaesturariibacter sp.]|nr:hypothetical protein [Flaviaesturariibacter sp.]